MQIIEIHNASFERLWDGLWRADATQHPFLTPLDVEYSKEYARDSRFDDLSFLVEENGTPILGLRMAIRKHPDNSLELSGFGRPITFLESTTVEPSLREAAAKMLCGQLKAQLDQNQFQKVLYQERRSHLSPVGRCLLDAGAEAIPRFTQVIELSASETELRMNLRKSYKSLVNWGEKNLQLTLRDFDAVTPDDMEAFRLLHVDVAGRETRSRRTWELQLEMIRRQEAFIILGRLAGDVVTAAFFNHSARYCYYFCSASRRELFEKPLAHVVLWQAIRHAKELGCRCFEMGDQLFPALSDSPPTPKELGISAFKKGFGGETQIRTDIVWNR
ncbi:MAG: GNAT family N-acetyltransferase [Verrucomicrobiota bacterium]